jgi:hypothetical protein
LSAESFQSFALDEFVTLVFRSLGKPGFVDQEFEKGYELGQPSPARVLGRRAPSVYEVVAPVRYALKNPFVAITSANTIIRGQREHVDVADKDVERL